LDTLACFRPERSTALKDLQNPQAAFLRQHGKQLGHRTKLGGVERLVSRPGTIAG